MSIALVQKVAAQTTVTAASLTTASITTTTGNFISVQGSQAISSTNPTSFTDNKSNSYTIDKAIGDASNGNFATNVALGSNLSITGGAGHTFTINKTGGGVGMAIGACEYSHTGAMSVTVTNVSANGGTSGGTAINPGAMNPTGANLLYVTAASNDNISGATYTATGTGFTKETSLSGTSSAKPSLVSSDAIGSGSKTGTFTITATTHWIAVGQTYLEAAAAGGIVGQLIRPNQAVNRASTY